LNWAVDTFVVSLARHRVTALAVDLHRLMGLPHLIDQGVEAPASFRGRHSGHRSLKELTQKRTACDLVPEANDASMRPALMAGFPGGLAGPNAPGLSILRREQGLNANWPAGEPLPGAAAMAASRRGARIRP